jgi:Ca2+-binding RTX toxin-like protein
MNFIRVYFITSIILFIVTINIGIPLSEINGLDNSTMIIENEAVNSVNTSNSNSYGTIKVDVIIEGTVNNDKIRGGAGNDEILGGAGDDLIRGMMGNDRLKGDQGDDTLMGDEGADELDGGPGADELDGGTGADELDGGEGADKYICDKMDKIIGFNSDEGDTKVGICKVKDKGALSSSSDTKNEDKESDKGKSKDKSKDSKGKIFPTN